MQIKSQSRLAGDCTASDLARKNDYWPKFCHFLGRTPFNIRYAPSKEDAQWRSTLSSTTPFLAAVSPLLVSKGDPSVDPSGHSRHPGTDFLFLPSEAQQTAKIPRVGFLAPQGRSLPLFDAFRQVPADLGYIDGHNITP